MKLTRAQRYLLSTFSGLLMVLCFPFTGSITPLVFIAWIPLLFVESYISRQNYRSGKVFIHAYLTFFIYNIGTTWWVWNASQGGAILAFLLNTLLMATVFYGFHLTKKYVGHKEGIIALVLYWIGFEYFHYDWESSWPWLTFGNVFSVRPSWIQWYSVSGALGGTLWILVINLLLFRTIENVYLRKETWRIQTPLFYIAGAALIIPLTISLITYYSYEEQKDPLEAILIQPNLNPLQTEDDMPSEKFSSDPLLQSNDMLKQAVEKVTPNTDIVLAPETAYWRDIQEERIQSNRLYSLLRSAQPYLNKADILWGVSSSRVFKKQKAVTMRPMGNGEFLEDYNASLHINPEGKPEFIRKSKLVPGVEKVPFANSLPFMSDWAISMDGTQVGYGVEDSPKIFKSKKFKFAPVICYESIFGGFVAEQCRKGAEVICIITNDGWWGDTPGYKQHASFASLRAIENRRSVLRSANTGTTCVVNQRGDILKATKWREKKAINATINLNSNSTVYSEYGDVLGRSFGFVSIFLLLFTFVRRFKKLFSK
ncbi:apolipoprotein N-acyltransferase [Crocinitomicaceae bacterium]|nr:apolipoprotein N-acyltransferase [Crocinitomicaceae bacterium]